MKVLVLGVFLYCLGAFTLGATLGIVVNIGEPLCGADRDEVRLGLLMVCWVLSGFCLCGLLCLATYWFPALATT